MRTRLKKVSCMTIIILITCVICSCEKDSVSKSGTSEDSIRTTATGGPLTTTSKVAAKTSAVTNTSISAAATSATKAVTTAEKSGESISSGTWDTETNTTQTDNDMATEIIADGDDKQTVTEDEKIDLQGKTITLTHYSATKLPRGEGLDDFNVSFYALRAKEAEELYNCKIQYKVETSSATTYMNFIINQSLAGIKYADIAGGNSSATYLPLLTKNLLEPLDEYIDFENSIMRANRIMYDNTLWKGRRYYIATAYVFGIGGLWYNRDILSREGQPDILDLIESKTWTWNSFLNIALNCTRDLNGDGIIDQWGVSAADNYNLMQRMFYSNNVQPVEYKNDRFEFSLDTIAAQRTLQFISDLAFQHKVVKTGQKNYENGYIAMFLTSVYGNNVNLDRGMNSVVSPLPLGPDISEYIGNGSTNQFYVLAASDLPREAAKILYHIFVIWDENCQRIPAMLELMKNLPKGWEQPSRHTSTEREYYINEEHAGPFNMDWAAVFGSSMKNLISNGLLNPIMNGSMSVHSAITSIKDQAQDIINAYN